MPNRGIEAFQWLEKVGRKVPMVGKFSFGFSYDWKIAVVTIVCLGFLFTVGSVYADAGNCLDFDGTNQWGTVPGGVIPNNGNFTVECWAYCATAPSAYCEILSQGASGNAFYIGTDTGNDIRLGDSWGSTGTAFPIGGWHHFALVKSSANTIFYLDGTNRLELGSAIANPVAADFRIGRQYGSHDEYWPGRIDEVRIWSNSLTAAQIRNNMHLALNGDEIGLAACWHFDENSGNVFTDATANENDGALSNTTDGVWVPSGVLLESPGESPVHYVWTNSPSSAWPYASWETAAHDIQTAVDVALSGETVLVTNGVYCPAAEITVSKTLVIESVNGPGVTTVDGQDARRCFNLGTSSCQIKGFTITRGNTSTFGGGISSDNYSPRISFCIVSNCHAGVQGGGMNYGKADNCLFTKNSASAGGAMRYTDARNCLVVANSGGGMYDCGAYNCIVWGNSGGGMSYMSSVYNSCSPDWVTHGIDGNIRSDPEFVDAGAGNYHLQPYSPCIDGGNNGYMPTSYDWDGTLRPLDGNGDGIATVDMGIYEAAAMPFTSNHYVSLSGSHEWPYTNWVMAATSIQVAVSAASVGNNVFITNGTYCPVTGIVVNVGIKIESINGPELTIVDAQDAHRGFELGTTACEISGLTVTRGFAAGSGGGIHCSNSTPVVTNCIVSHSHGAYGGGMDYGTAYGSQFASNSASFGGAMYYGTAQNCHFTGNSAATNGGALDHGAAQNCHFTGNSASRYGGAMDYGTAENCYFTGNSAPFGAVMRYGVARNCTIVSNSGSSYGGLYDSSAYNCIAWYNTPNNLAYMPTVYNTCSPDGITPGVDGNIASNPQFVDGAGHLNATSPCVDAGSNGYMPSGPDLDEVPRPLDGNADGTNTVDMGCYEFASALVDADADGLSDSNEVYEVGTSPVLADTDGDAVNDGDEVFADTNPFNSNSYFAVTAIDPSRSRVVTFFCTNSRTYSLAYTTNLVNGEWLAVDSATNVLGSSSSMSLTDTVDSVQRSYRVGVDEP